MQEINAVPATGPLTVLTMNHPHSTVGKYIEADHMVPLSHIRALYSDGNSKFYKKLEETMHDTTYKGRGQSDPFRSLDKEGEPIVLC